MIVVVKIVLMLFDGNCWSVYEIYFGQFIGNMHDAFMLPYFEQKCFRLVLK